MDSFASLGSLSSAPAVLVIEDNAILREIAAEILSDDYEVLQAENGNVGFALLKDNFQRISAVLLDIYMPECNGFTFLERKQATPCLESIPVIVMTTSDSIEDEIKCLTLGASEFVIKPFDNEVMRNRVKNIIRLSESSSMLNRLEKDKLTSLFSKEFFSYYAKKILTESESTQYDLVCVDIQNFRALNERYERKKCDDALCYLSRRMQALLPGIVIGGRIGSDILAFLIHHAEKGWVSVLEGTVDQNAPFPFSVKYGIMQHIDHTLPVSTLCDRTLFALNAIKKKFNINVGWFDSDLHQALIREQAMIDEMESALQEKQFRVFFQPKYDIQKDCVSGAEALVRWIHPTIGFISPVAFIPLFERNGFIRMLDPYIWEECCQEIARCRDLGLPQVPISINVSRMLFDEPDLVDLIIEIADRYGLDHSLLHIELTESASTEKPELIAEKLRRLHDNGFVIELDDFGAGYSTLTSLRTLTLDIMKLDMSIIRHASRTKDYSIMRYSVLLAECMKLKTIAEGVETREELDALRVLGCDYVQGYYYSKPLPRDEFERYLEKFGRNATGAECPSQNHV